MKKLFFILVFCGIYLTLSAQSDYVPPQFTQRTDANFRLFPTRNMYNFIRLDTRTGQMDMVQWSTDGKEGTYTLSNRKLTYLAEEEIPGRFTLYATTNFYNFILLDQIDGRVWQVQWSFDENKRLVTRIW